MKTTITPKERWKRAWTRARASQKAYDEHGASGSHLIKHLMNAFYQTSGLTRQEQHVVSSWQCLAMGALLTRDVRNYQLQHILESSECIHYVIDNWDEYSRPNVVLNEQIRGAIQARADLNRPLR